MTAADLPIDHPLSFPRKIEKESRVSWQKEGRLTAVASVLPIIKPAGKYHAVVCFLTNFGSR